MYERLLTMIEAGEWMFQKSWESAVAGTVDPQVKEDIYRRDVEVNKNERAIRKRIVEHLTVQPGVDVPACLVLMSVVKDAERIGDYCKNMLEAAEFQDESIAKCPFCQGMNEIYDEVKLLFSKTRQALAESDVTLGHEIILEERDISGRCDALVERFTKEDLSSKKAVPWALLVRHVKRIAAHLGNLASSLVMPLHKLDYFDEKLLPDKSEENKA
jgi:phosphate uptake regulator